MFMPKTALSITLDQDNLLWLRAQTAAAKGKSLSDTLDQLVTAARQAGRVADGAIRSVSGTIDITDDDPDLAGADAYVRGLFDRSARQPWLARETGPASRVAPAGPAGAAVADAVTDTHALIFHAVGGGRLGPKARAQFDACERRDAIIYVPVPVIWEVSLLARAVRINLRRSVRAFFGDLFSNPAYQPLDLTAAHVLDADELRFTRDPFDALICAAARDLSLPLVTPDTVIARSGVVRVVW